MILYRVPSGYNHSPGTTAADVVQYEQRELGNNLGIRGSVLKSLAQFPASRINWYCLMYKDALRYGYTVEQYNITDDSVIIATDGDGGYLILQAQ